MANCEQFDEGVVMSSVTPDPATSSSAAGSRRTGRSGNRERGNRAGSLRTGSTTVTSIGSTTVFAGNTEEMNVHVFQCYEEQNDRRQYANH
jgi:hypothetical protein